MTDKETEAQKQAQKLHRWLETGLKFSQEWFSHPKQWPQKKKRQKWKCVRGENNRQRDEQMGIHRQVPVVFRRPGPGNTPWLWKDG